MYVFAGPARNLVVAGAEVHFSAYWHSIRESASTQGARVQLHTSTRQTRAGTRRDSHDATRAPTRPTTAIWVVSALAVVGLVGALVASWLSRRVPARV